MPGCSFLLVRLRVVTSHLLQGSARVADGLFIDIIVPTGHQTAGQVAATPTACRLLDVDQRLGPGPVLVGPLGLRRDDGQVGVGGSTSGSVGVEVLVELLGLPPVEASFADSEPCCCFDSAALRASTAEALSDFGTSNVRSCIR